MFLDLPCKKCLVSPACTTLDYKCPSINKYRHKSKIYKFFMIVFCSAFLLVSVIEKYTAFPYSEYILILLPLILINAWIIAKMDKKLMDSYLTNFKLKGRIVDVRR